MPLDIDCPQCGHIESVDEASLPKGQATLTCKQCRYKWPFHRPASLGRPKISAPPPAPPAGESRRAEPSSRPVEARGEVTCPGCGLRFEPGRAGRRPESAAAVATAGKVDSNTVPSETDAPRPARLAKPKRRRRAGGKKTILVVEDVDYFVQLAQDALGAKYRTIIVKTVEEAVQTIEREPIDLLVLDLTLGGEDSSSLLERLEPKEFPVLISTSRDETEMYGEAWESLKRQGADDLVIKGMNMEETLLQKVADLLGAD